MAIDPVLQQQSQSAQLYAKKKKICFFSYKSLNFCYYIGHLHISTIHILRIHITRKQRMQHITLIHLSQQQQQPQQPRRQRQVKLSNSNRHLHPALTMEWIPLISLLLMMPWEVLAWIYEFRPSSFKTSLFSLINHPSHRLKKNLYNAHTTLTNPTDHSKIVPVNNLQNLLSILDL